MQKKAVISAVSPASMSWWEVACTIVWLAVHVVSQHTCKAGWLLATRGEKSKCWMLMAGQITTRVVRKYKPRVLQTINDCLLTQAYRSVHGCLRRWARVWDTLHRGRQKTKTAAWVPSSQRVTRSARLRARLSVWKSA